MTLSKFVFRAHALGVAIAVNALCSIAGAQAVPTAPASAPLPPQPSPAYPLPVAWDPKTDPTVDQRARRPIQDDPALPPAERVALHPYIALIGARGMIVSDPGFDAFSTNDSLMAFTLGVGRSLYSGDNVSFALMAFWDAGGRSSNVRGEPTELFVHRLSLGPELRWHPLQDGYLFGRVSPAMLNTVMTLNESSTASAHLAQSDDADLGFLSSWDFGVDVSAGLAYEVFGSGGRRSGPVRFWVFGEGGYGWATNTALDFVPEADDPAAPERVAVLDQGELGLRGPFFRLAAATTF